VAIQYFEGIVCNSTGGYVSGSLDFGKSITASDDPYTFYVYSTGFSGRNHQQQVKLVMPVGGPEAGLYRFPRVGESVLVAHDDTGSIYYLVGYIPSKTAMPFQKGIDEHKDNVDKTKDVVVEDYGQVLRYQQTGKTDTALGEAGSETDEIIEKGAERYSEIGFYHRETSWEPSEEDKEDYRDIPRGSKKPKIDLLNIQSTGDITGRSVNYTGHQAKRMEIVVDGGDEDFELEKETDAGDLQIRARHNITIEAGASITLKVGRSRVVINDNFLDLVSAKTASNLGSFWDTRVRLSPIFGLTGMGSHVRFSSAGDCALTNLLGGGFSSNLGVTRISGVDVKMSSMPSLKEAGKIKAYVASMSLNLAASLAGIGLDAGGKAPNERAEGMATGDYGKLVNNVAGFFQALESFLGEEEEEDATEAYVGAVLVAIQIIDTVAFLLCQALPLMSANTRVAGNDRNGGSIARDAIVAAVSAAEMGLLISAAVTLSAAKPVGAEASVGVGGTPAASTATVSAQQVQETTTERQTAASPVAGVSLPSPSASKSELIAAIAELVEPIGVILMESNLGDMTEEALESL